MPYIGNAAGNRFVASKAASVYSGNGSTTAFTLEHAVGSDEDILVSVDGVIQEPSVAYAVSSGTTLTFTAAPSSNSGNNIFVYYLFRTVATVDHPSTSALSATSGTFSTDLTVNTNTLIVDSTNNSVGIGASPDSNRDLHIKRTGANASILIEETSATNYGQFIELKDSSTSWFISNRYATTGTGSSGFGIGTTNSGDMLQIDTNGHVIIPNQPAFQAQPTGDNNNVTGDATTFSAVNIAFTEIFDNNGDFNHNDGTNRGKFTAPVTGRYLLGISCFFSGVTSASTSGVVAIATSNRTYNRNFNPYNVANVGVNGNYNFCILADMDINDTANFSLYVNGNGSKVVDLAGSQSTFYGHLVC